MVRTHSRSIKRIGNSASAAAEKEGTRLCPWTPLGQEAPACFLPLPSLLNSR